MREVEKDIYGRSQKDLEEITMFWVFFFIFLNQKIKTNIQFIIKYEVKWGHFFINLFSATCVPFSHIIFLYFNKSLWMI